MMTQTETLESLLSELRIIRTEAQTSLENLAFAPDFTASPFLPVLLKAYRTHQCKAAQLHAAIADLDALEPLLTAKLNEVKAAAAEEKAREAERREQNRARRKEAAVTLNSTTDPFERARILSELAAAVR